MKSIYVKLAVKNSKLHFPLKSSKTKIENFLKFLPDNTDLEMFISANISNATNSQLAKIHVMIREIANETGHTFNDIKYYIKKSSGLYFINNDFEYCKSFSDCSKNELNLVIQSCIEIGDFLNIQLR